MSIHASQPTPTVNFSESELRHVAENYPHMPLSAGEILFEEGSPSSTAFIVLDGELEVLKKTDDRHVLLGIVGKGELIGEMSLLTGSAPHGYHARPDECDSGRDGRAAVQRGLDDIPRRDLRGAGNGDRADAQQRNSDAPVQRDVAVERYHGGRGTRTE